MEAEPSSFGVPTARVNVPRDRRVPLAALLLAGALGGCDWLSLAANALTYDTLRSGEAGNVVAASDSTVYATIGSAGITWLDARSGKTLGTMPPPEGLESVDDLAIDGNLLFVLDAQAPGHLAVLSIAGGTRPSMVGNARPVAVGPFSGVSAADNVVMVSGGTSELAVFEYDATGVLTAPMATADLGRGQPDILVTPRGLAYVSTHYWGPYFGINALRYDRSTHSITALGKLPLKGAGFTAGGAKPANFPIDVAAIGADTILVAFAGGVAVLRASDQRLELLEVIKVDGKAVSIDTRQNVAAVATTGSNAGVVILDFAGSTPVIKRLSLPPGTNPAGIAFTGSRVAIAARDKGVLLIDQ